MRYGLTLRELAVRCWATVGTPYPPAVPGEIVVALVKVAEAAQEVVDADRMAWQQSDLDNAVIALRELVEPPS